MRRDHTVISREIKRNSSGRNKYRADTAQKKCEDRKHKQRKGKLDKYPELKKYIEKKLLLDWSPEQITGRLKEHPPDYLKGLTFSHQSIYEYIYNKAEKHKKLYKHLRTHRNKRKKQCSMKYKKTAITSRVSIHERPDIINNRLRYGDWESDTVEFRRSRNNPYLSVQYERKSQLVRIHKINKKTAELTKQALIKTAESVPNEIFKTITLDNGSEGAKHHELKHYYPDIQTFFCDPFCSWQKGGVENMNKLIRQYLPKSTDMTNISDNDIIYIQNKINNRPRKNLNYFTPNEIINKVVHA